VHGEEDQTLVANVDLMFIVMGLDNDFNISRLERYLLLATGSGVSPVVILNKSDLATNLEEQVEAVRKVVGQVPVEVVSALTGDAMAQVSAYLTPGVTAVLLGSSGAGKSTITNWLLQTPVQAVRETRTDDGRGRHTTTSRQLFTLPGGGHIIDTPGMRELGVAEADDQDADAVFQTIERLATECKFRNCDHELSQGCAVLEAMERGEITEREVHNYQKLMRERLYNESKEANNKHKYQEQIMKREKQYNEAARRKRLSRGTY
jgi:ribosome biogenesis GTPase